jgi:phosphoglycerate dehydrogenase-like enzyme
LRISAVDSVYLERRHIARLRSLGKFESFEDNPGSQRELVARIDGSDIIIVGWTAIPKEVLQSSRNLRMISVWGTGYEFVDVESATSRGIIVSNVPRYAGESVAEHALALILSLTRHLNESQSSVKRGNWDWRSLRGRELRNQTIGIIGAGDTGSALARLAGCLGMHVLVHSRTQANRKGIAKSAEFVGLERLLEESDIVSLHVPLTAETKGLIGNREFRLMKRHALFLNSSRGEVVDEVALVSALKSGRIAGAGLDTLNKEPPSKKNPLLRMKNVIVTPHVAFDTDEALRRCTDTCLSNIAAFKRRRPENVVNPGVISRSLQDPSRNSSSN